MPSINEKITENTQGNWKIWDEDHFLDVLGVFYPYFTQDYTISHRIRFEPVVTKDETIKNLKYNTFEANKGGPLIESGGDAVIVQNCGMLKQLDIAKKGECYNNKAILAIAVTILE